MPTLTQAILFVIGSFVFALLIGRFLRAGAGQEAPPPAPDEAATKLANRLDALVTERKAAELAWMIELQERIAERQAELASMELFPTTHNIIKLRTLIRVQIDGDERALELLRKRGERDSAASHYEGRM